MDLDKIGTTNDEFTLNIDLATTILSAANIQPPSNTMQGKDISLLYRTTSVKDKGISQQWRKDFYYEHPALSRWNPYWIPKSEALVTKRYKYIKWPYFNKEQLFDLHNDKHEEYDLVANNNGSHILDNRIDVLLHSMRDRFQLLKQRAL